MTNTFQIPRTARTATQCAPAMFCAKLPCVPNPMAAIILFFSVQFLAAAALMQDAEWATLIGVGLVGVLTGSALGMLVATSERNHIAWSVWGRRFAMYYLAGAIAGPVLFLLAEHWGLVPSALLAFACGGLGGFFGLGVALALERRARKTAADKLDKFLDESPMPPTPKSETIRLCPPTKKM